MQISPKINPAILAAVQLLRQIKPEVTEGELVNWLNENQPPKAVLPEKPLTRKETCNLLGISYPSLHRWIRAGRLKSIRIGKRAVRISPQSVRELLEGGKHE